MAKREFADRVAVVVAIVFVFLGGLLVFSDGLESEEPTKTTTVVKTREPAVAKRTITSGPDAPSAVIEQPAGAGYQATTTTEVGATSWVERSLGDGGTLLLKVIAVLLAAFVAAAFAQRLLIGEFALKLGPLEFGAVQEKTEATLVDLTAEIASISERQNRQAETIEGLGRRVGDSLAHLLTFGTALSEMRQRLDDDKK